MTEQTILYDSADAVARITLNRPDKLNSFTAEMHGELRAALAKVTAAGSGIRCVLLTGAGRGFCAGQDLSQRRGDASLADLGQTLDTLYNPLIRSLRALEMPVICAVNGIAAGAGANLALAADIVLAARSASFLQAFAKIGLMPDSGGTYFLPRLIGDARARALAMLAERISAEQAAAWGMIWKVVDDDKLMDDATALAKHLATQPTRALAAIKQAFNASQDNTLDQQLDLERDWQRALGKSNDYREGVAAFFEKRPPNFTGS
jgi:2-(1,2-epoxy-1,2-dihydrophenyl)acetyl-CoA isomerase